jgi:ribosome-binding factor A
LVTITRVKLASDLGAATIFYSPLGEDPDEERKVELDRIMRRVTSFVRRTLSKRVKLRHTPELRFVFDDSIKEGSHTLGLIRSLELDKDVQSENLNPEESEGGPAGVDEGDGETEPTT